MEVYLIRHTSVAVPPGTCYGFSDVPLNSTFEQEAGNTRKTLEGLHFDHVYTSPLSRATRLATYCGFPEAEHDDRIKEMNMGEWELQRFEQITDPELQEWYDNYLYTPTKGGEAFIDLYRRVGDFLTELRTKPYEKVAVFAHGGVLICAQVFAGVIPIESGFDHLTPYGGVVRIEL